MIEGPYKRQFGRYLAILSRWNRAYNLTATPMNEVPQRHFAECLALSPHIPTGARVADLGSGAGFPGMVLAVVREDLSFDLIESVGKKALFLQLLAESLSLTGRVNVLQVRVESLPHDAQYDCVTARAFADLAKSTAMAWPLLKPNGIHLTTKGEHLRDELALLPADPYPAPELHELPGTRDGRIVILRKP